MISGIFLYAVAASILVALTCGRRKNIEVSLCTHARHQQAPKVNQSLLKDSGQRTNTSAPSPKPLLSLLKGGRYSGAHCKVVACTDEEDVQRGGTIHNTRPGGCLSHYSLIIIILMHCSQHPCRRVPATAFKNFNKLHALFTTSAVAGR
jgi:hypothetical protein